MLLTALSLLTIYVSFKRAHPVSLVAENSAKIANDVDDAKDEASLAAQEKSFRPFNSVS